MNRNLTIGSWIVATTLASTALAGNGVFVVSYNEGKIYWVAADRSGAHVIHTSLAPNPTAIAFDSQGTSTLYWSKGPVYEAAVDGRDETLVATGFGEAGAMALDPIHNFLYIAETTQCESSSTNSRGLRRLDLSDNTVLTIDGSADCGEGIAVDPAGGKIYWASSDPTHSRAIYRADLDGSNKETLIGSGEVGSYLALDVGAGHIYWSAFSGGQNFIRRSNLSDGGQTETLINTGSLSVAGLVIDPDADHIYWILYGGTAQIMRRAHRDGSNIETMFGVSASTFLTSIVLDNRTPFCTQTAMYADITNLQGSVEFGDVSAVVDAFRGQPTIDPTLCDLYPCDLGGRRCMGDALIDFRDVSQVVDAFRNVYTNCPQ